ncbi:MAG TPA: dTDP-glucose 4,6-dehydratase [Micromonosporaceae bacterium]|nr:dTDP-glucose 4,6-dehydratase [Micromonosporaceae bacterium]
MRILVTGGAGFIGSHYVRTALTGGYPALAGAAVTVVDSLRLTGDFGTLSTVAGHPDLTLVPADICDAPLIDDVVAGQDMIVHFAAESHVDNSIADPARFVRTNVVGTQVLLDAARRHDVSRFVQVSTDEVYGSMPEGAWTEAAPCAPNSPYAATKAAADMLVLAAHRTYGLDAVVTRSVNTYGPYQYPEKIVPLFLANLLRGGTVPLYGDGGNIRQWLHVDDHCWAVETVRAGGVPGGIYHVGGSAELTNRELTAVLLEACGAGPERIAMVADRPGHDRRYALDDTLIRQALGYAPRVGFADGMASTVAWYRANRAWWEPFAPASRPS